MNYAIKGGAPLAGSIDTNTSKNAATALLCAALLNRGQTTLVRMPRIEEVNRIIEVLVSIGVEVAWRDSDVILTPPKKLRLKEMDEVAAGRTRSIIMLAGVLSHWSDDFLLPVPGGCDLGSRSLTAHIDALDTLGINLEGTAKGWRVCSEKKRVAEIVMWEASDTGTEQAVMAAVLIPGITTIRFASANYMVQDMCVFLESLGVRIDGIGTTTLVVHGVEKIDGEHVGQPSEDPIEAMFFLALAATLKAPLTIKSVPIDFLEIELLYLSKMGLRYTRSKSYIGGNGWTRLVDLTIKPSKLTAIPEKIAPLPYPGLNIDNLPFFVPIATQAAGRTLIHDWVYENRAIYYVEMNKLGADIVLADPHRVFVNGPTSFRSADIEAPPALRPATTLLIGMLGAEGESTLRNVYPINRGYERLHERLKKLGAHIEAYE